MGIREKFAKLNPQDSAQIEALFQQTFKNILINLNMGAIGKAAKTTPIEIKYNVLKQYVEQGGGTLRLANKNTITFAPKEVKNAAIHGKFRQGGIQGKTQLDGI